MRLRDKIKTYLVLKYGKKTAKKRSENKGDNQNVCIIKQDGIGDFILFIPAFEELKRFYKDKKITLFTSLVNSELAKKSGLFDEVVTFEKKEFENSALRKTYKRFSSFKFDVLLHPTQPRTVEAEILAHFIDAKEKIASKGEAGALPQALKDKFDTIYDRLIDTGEDMTFIQSAKFIRGLGDGEFLYTLPKIKEVNSCSIPLPDDFFIVFMGGSVYNKLYPPENFYKIACHIAKKTGKKCLLLGDKFDLEQLESFKGEENLEYISLIGKTTLSELLYVISKSSLVVGNDTCAIHMANALSVPSVCVRGQFSGDKFYPYKVEVPLKENDVLPVDVKAEVKCKGCTKRGGGYFCLHGDYFSNKKVKCLMRVTVDDVIRAVDQVLDKNKI